MAIPHQTHTLRSPLPAGGTTTRPDDFIVGARHLEHAQRINDVLPEQLKVAFGLLRLNILSALLVKQAFIPIDDGRSPAGATDLGCDPVWWPAANTAASLAAAVHVQLCSYRCENDGRLFAHLVPSNGDGASAIKSRKSLSGHTDASALPLPNEDCDRVAPSPDLVILACIRNPDGVETRIAPLSRIRRGIDDATVAILEKPLFDFRPQASFSMNPSFVSRAKPVLLRDRNEGLLIRFSHSNVTSETDEGRHALVALKAAIATSFVGIAMAPGDVLFVNNRTALHGRSDIPAHASNARWLLRTYGMYARQAAYGDDASRPFLLLPAAGGPAPITEPTSA